MFEKSKSAITFKEFQTNMNIANNFYDDWGHFCDPDLSNNNAIINANILFQDTLHKQKREFKKLKLFQNEESKEKESIEKESIEKESIEKEIEKIIKEIFIDIENDNPDENDNQDENDNKKNNDYLKDAIKATIAKNIFKCFKVIFVTSIMIHFIFNIL